MVELPISDHEAALVLSTLGYFDEEVLPHSVPRIDLYKIIKYIQETFGFEVYDGYVPTASERFTGDVRTIDLSPDTADYIERALWCAISLGSCEVEMDSEYAGGFSRDLQDLCSVDLRLRDILGPRCFEPLPKNKSAWDEVFGVS
ncbi:MAG: hypothetical protein ABR985_12905 [Methanotrichaceae archaeon]|jgi:hypothetical protein